MTSYADTGLSNGTTKYYVVAAVNSIGESGNPNQASATPVGSGVISLVNAVRGGGNRGTAASSEASTTNMNVSVGNLIVIALGFAGTLHSTAPTDTAENSYVECCFTENNGVASTIWYAKNTIANSSDAIAVHFSSATRTSFLLRPSTAERARPVRWRRRRSGAARRVPRSPRGVFRRRLRET